MWNTFGLCEWEPCVCLFSYWAGLWGPIISGHRRHVVLRCNQPDWVFFCFSSPGWKLNPVVGAVYAPELYAGKFSFPFLPSFSHTQPAIPEATISCSQSQSDPRTSTIELVLHLLNMKFPSNQSESESGPDKQWMIQACLSGWGSLSHCLLAVQL